MPRRPCRDMRPATRKADNLPGWIERPSAPAGRRCAHPPKDCNETLMTRRGPTGWRGEDPNLEFEKSRYADPIASRELLLKHLAEAPEPLTAARLAKGGGPRTL